MLSLAETDKGSIEACDCQLSRSMLDATEGDEINSHPSRESQGKLYRQRSIVPDVHLEPKDLSPRIFMSIQLT